MDVVEAALSELHNRENLQTPDNLSAFFLARQILGKFPINEALDITPYAIAFHEQAGEDDLLDSCQDYIELEDFIPMVKDALHKVKYPAGREMEHLANRARNAPIPAAIDHLKGDLLTVARVCRVLQDDAGKKPFYLSQENAGRLIGKQRAAGGRKLFTLQDKKIIQLISKGFKGRASYYLWSC